MRSLVLFTGMDKGRNAPTPAKKTGDWPQSLEMRNAGAENNERSSYLSQKARSMSLYGSQFLQQARSPNYALFCLSETNPVRKLSKLIVESKVFEYFILLAIGANCIVLALATPLPQNDHTDLSIKLDKSEYYFVGIFCIEALLKIMAFGFVLHPGSYLRNGWNILDFVVIVVGIISLPEVSALFDYKDVDVKALRAVRVLRPLKLISGVPSLQVVMKSIVRAMVPLLQIALLVLFCILIYAIIGMEFLKDKFHSSCYNKTHELEANPRPCDMKPWPGVRKIFHGRSCPEDYECKDDWDGPNGGISTFDNVALAMITVFQCITMEGWTQIMYWTFDAVDKNGYLYSCYFVSLIVIGSFFVLNLVLGVLSGEFAKERERVDTRRKFFKVRRQQQLERQVHAYQSWIDKAAEIAADENSYRKKHLSLNDSQSQLVTNDMVSNPGRVVARQQGNSYRVNMPVRDSTFQRFMQWKTKASFKVRAMVKTQAFYWTVLVCVFLNTIVLAVEYHNQPNWLTDFQRNAEIVFLVFFIVEMLLKLFGLGINQYFSSSFNCFDCAVVFSGILDMILENQAGIKIGSSVLRCVRLLRVFKVTRHWRSLRNLATSLVSSLKSIVSLIFLLFLFILIAALLGMQIFGGKFIADNEDPPRTNFDNFQNAMLAVFQILTGEDWNSVMYYGINALGGPHKWKGILGSLYFILLVILGNYTLLNVFLAIAVDNLANAQILTEDEELEKQERLQKREQNKQKYSQKAPSGWRRAGAKLPVVMAINHFVRKKNGHASTSVADPNNISMENGDTLTMSSSLKRKIRTYRREASYYDKAEDRNGGETAEPRENSERKAKTTRNKNRRMKITRRKNEANGNNGREEEDDEEEDDHPITRKNFMKVLKTGRFGKRRRPSRKSKPLIKTKTMFIFSPENRFRRLCHRIVNLRHFDNFMLIIIVLSSITIALEDPLDDKSEKNKILMHFDYVFTAIFALEVVVKVVDIGVILHKGAYFRDLWNVIDALVVSFNMASLILYHTDTSSSGKSVIRALRVFRVLRPFKGVHKIKKLQAVFRCMWYSVKNVANILIITMLFLFIFAVMGVQLFRGKFQECNDKSKLWEKECKGQYFIFKFDETSQQQEVKKVENRSWTTRKLNFDNVGNAMVTLFTSSTGEGWPSAMHRTMATTEKDQGPIDDYSPAYAIYYISFVVVFSFFFLNIFVALIILTFQEEGEREIASCELDRNQRDCIQFALTAKPAQRYMPTDQKSLRYKIWKLVMSKPFDTFIMVLIALNTGVLMSQHYKEPPYFTDILMYLNIGFTVLYVLEAGLKFIALRQNYFRDYWNIFDFIVVLGGLLDITLTLVVKFTATKENPLGIGIDPSMFRLFRAARLLKLLRRGYTIRILLWTFLQSFKALPYVTLLISLMFFMYAVVGMQLFGKIKLDPDTKIDEKNNFRDLGQALQVLFRSATGEDWHEIMQSCYNDAECDPKIEADNCGSTLGAILYFCTFIFLCMFLMLNLFVAVIMDNFEYLTRDESILGPHHLDEFVRVWSEFDPGASGCIHHSEIYKVMCSMSPPVGFGKKCPKIVGYKRLIKMNMPLNEDGTVSFSTTLFALIRTSLNIKLRGNMNANDTELRKMIKRVWPKTSSDKVLNKLIPKQSVLSCQQMTIGKIYCAKLIHENYKYLKRKNTPTERIEREEERSYRHSKGGLFSKLVGSLRHKKRHEREDIELGRVERRRNRAFTSDARLNLGRNISRLTSLEDNPANLKRHRSWGPSPKLNGDVKKNGMQPHPESSHAMMDVSVPCSVATPSVAEQLAVIPPVYLTPSERRNYKVPRLAEGASIHLDSSSDSDTGVDVDHDPPHLRQNPYYDEMITRINSQLEAAVAGGTSPYAIYGLEEDDADDWC